jgi:hypothetical protein
VGLAKKNFSRDRIEFAGSLSEKEIREVVSNTDVRVLQTSAPVDVESWKRINDQLISVRPEIEIRIYGHYSSECDLSLVEYIPDVQNISIDCLMRATNTDSISQLRNLSSLSVGIYNLESFEFLKGVPLSLKKLSIGATKSKKPDLIYLNRFVKLQELYIEGQNKNIDMLGQLSSLKKLVLRSTSPKDISFIRDMNNLWSLDIKLGGIKDLKPLEGLDNIKYLELWQINGLSDISVISSLNGLEFLFLQALRNVVALPDASRLVNLRRVYLETMKGLKDVSGIFKSPSLEEYIHVCAQNMKPAQYAELLKHKTLKKALFGFGSDKKNKEIEDLMRNNGVERYQHEPFVFC